MTTTSPTTPLAPSSKPTSSKPTARRQLVLVGGGHSHVQVLRRFAMEPPANTALTLVVDMPIAVYSGMVPGYVAGQYRAEELEIDVVPLARRAGARVILSRAMGVDPVARRILVAGRPAVPYDVASFDIGSTVAGQDLPGIQQFALLTRPIGRFVGQISSFAERIEGQKSSRVLVVGAGAGGVELAFTLRQRIPASAEIVLIHSGRQILPGYPASMVSKVMQAAERHGIEVRLETSVTAATAREVSFADGSQLAYDGLVWVTGAVSQPVFRDSGLTTDDRGFVSVRSTLQVADHDELFAVGDCATMVDFPSLPKAGVYAVRQGPYLIDNLRAALAGRPLRSYKPQTDFLTLLNLGDGSAIGGKWGRAFEGRWVMRWKDHIDRKFMRRFQVLEADGGLSAEFPEMDEMAVLCGGCAAKVGQSVLERALQRLPAAAEDPSVVMGLQVPDDAAAVTGPHGDLRVSTLDAFKAFTDDPFLVGRVAAVNAVSDLLAKGVEPRHALALVTLPEALTDDESEEMLFQVLAGVRAALDPLGTTLLGGHTTTATELLVGLSVEGTVEGSVDCGAEPAAQLMAIDRLQPGEHLILTKALGTGVLFHADMRGRARGTWVENALLAMQRDNQTAARVARTMAASASTDITGFGLVGHVGEMLRASGCGAVIEVASLPALPGSLELLARGERSTFHEQNARALRGLAVSGQARRQPQLELLFDPQTSGGLVFGVVAERSADAVAALHAAGERDATVIGWVRAESESEARIELR